MTDVLFREWRIRRKQEDVARRNESYFKLLTEASFLPFLHVVSPAFQCLRKLVMRLLLGLTRHIRRTKGLFECG